ncbi:hypothetical protein NPS53_09665 [Pseudomonas putida]|uniref:hypothetical protein n=1 Tax=Pseudomonas putida TaxID=303 RepID=UPI0023631C4F|nr:hypothetical protein [Pseudomonas putida]MDD2139845.1 hypothetical protein [Pseudomonas putida]HDS1721768.1 hypothetical protein [Pseudomonas putida]
MGVSVRQEASPLELDQASYHCWVTSQRMYQVGTDLSVISEVTQHISDVDKSGLAATDERQP